MKMWDGRFEQPTDRLMEEFHNSLGFDRELIEEDVEGSIAWAGALARAGIISRRERDAIAGGLRKVLKDYRNGAVRFQPGDEDIHMAVERLLVEKIGDAAQRLHTGRSRNDQVATDLRMYLKERLVQTRELVRSLQAVLLERAGKDADVVVPGYTHLQQAQPVLLAHYWLSFLFLLEREKSRLEHALATADEMPLGSGAVAGTGFAVDRAILARDLGFAKPCDNSMDGVAARDFVLEALAALSSIGISLSRYAEDLIIWSSREFGFVELDDAWATGSSMMPQKKNPDSLELIRAKAGRLAGNYARLAATLKGVGLTYYKDLQEDKESLFDSLRSVRLCLDVFARLLATLQVRREAIGRHLDPLLWATDLADYLVNRRVPFRQAHKIVGAIVKHCVKTRTPLDKLDLDVLRAFSAKFGADVKKVFSWKQAVAHRDAQGGTGPGSLRRQMATARRLVRK